MTFNAGSSLSITAGTTGTGEVVLSDSPTITGTPVIANIPAGNIVATTIQAAID